MGDDSPCCSPSGAGRDRADDAGLPAAGQPAAGSSPSTRGKEVPVETVRVPAGTFVMGCDDERGHPADGEGPAHRVALDAYRLGATAVTNDEFAAFVAATGHRTTAERFATSFVFAGHLPDDFAPTRGVVGAPWWREVEGADWAHPHGPQSSLTGRGDHPVVHVSWDDATAYCDWAGARLPTEAEWERGARGGLVGASFPWGHERHPGGEVRMRTFVGDFPRADPADAPGPVAVRSYPANGFGLFETTGNVWEWCADWFAVDTYRRRSSDPESAPTGPPTGSARVMRGGSYLCHDSYCRRYRVDARSPNPPDSTADNVGFRVAADP